MKFLEIDYPRSRVVGYSANYLSLLETGISDYTRPNITPEQSSEEFFRLNAKAVFMEFTIKRAWLITWEWMGDHAKKEKEIISILNAHISPENVKSYIEQLYVDSECSLTDRLQYAKNRKNILYPAHFGDIDGVCWKGHIHCGDNPFINARFVKNLRVEFDMDGQKCLKWEAILRPKLPKT